MWHSSPLLEHPCLAPPSKHALLDLPRSPNMLGKNLDAFHSTLGFVRIMDKKIGFFNQFFGEKSVFSSAGKDFRVEKSEVKKSVKNRRFFLEKKILIFSLVPKI